jgi:hypothetical protein
VTHPQRRDEMEQHPLSPRARFWTHKLAEATSAHKHELARMNTPGGANLKTLERYARAIERARRELNTL